MGRQEIDAAKPRRDKYRTLRSETTEQERGYESKQQAESDKTEDGVSRDTLNDWQRKDAAKNTGEAKHPEAGPKDAGKQAEG